MTIRIASTLLLCLLLSACYRTHYVNFSPQNPIRGAAATPDEPVRSGWQHFFLWGLVPGEKPIDAREACGGSERIHSIQTRQTFLEGLRQSPHHLLHQHLLAMGRRDLLQEIREVVIRQSAVETKPVDTRSR